MVRPSGGAEHGRGVDGLKLPSGWTFAHLGELATLQTGPFGSSLHQADYVHGGIPLINPMHIVGGRVVPRSEHAVSPEMAKRLVDFQVSPGDLVIGRRGEMGRCAVITDRERGWLCGTGSMVIRCGAALLPRFLQQLLSSRELVEFLGQESVGSTMANLNQKVLLSVPIRLPPVADQARILDALDELFPALAAGTDELDRAKGKLALYRQSLLKAAVEGALTAEWRERNPPQETGTELLARILRERRARWQARQLAKFKVKGTAPPKDWQAKYPEPVKPDDSDLPGLPGHWCWTSLDTLGELASGVAKGSKFKPGEVMREVPYLRVANVQRGRLDLDEVKTILASERDITELSLVAGDVLFNEGGDRDKLGRGWVWSGEVPECIHQNHVFRMRPVLPDIAPDFVSHHGNTFGRRWFESAGKQTTNLASINLSILRSFPVPVPPADEQRQIIALVQEQLAVVREQAIAVDRGLRLAAAQRQNILRAAFTGQLVSQDPADEPASALLARICAERDAQAAAPQARRPRKRRETA